MLPEHGAVVLMEAYGTLDDHRLPATIGHDRVDVPDFLQQSQPSSSDVVMYPSPHSPMSNALAIGALVRAAYPRIVFVIDIGETIVVVIFDLEHLEGVQ
jgi:hypothetical protein